MVRTYQTWAQKICAPVFYEDAKGETHNGTMTFLRTDEELLGITNKHVARSVAESAEAGKNCKVGGAPLEPDRLIAEHRQFDLATYRLSDVLLANVGLLADGSGDPAKHQPATVTEWPPVPASEGAPVMYGGYPGDHRSSLADGNVEFGFFWFANKVLSLSDRNIGMVINSENSISVGDRPIKAGSDLGGWSGGPVFRVIQENAIERLELSGIIYECSGDTGIVLAHPLIDLNPDGTFE